MRGLPLLVVALGVVLAVPSSAAAAGWTCESSAVRARILTSAAIEPVTANAGAGDCKAATGGLSTTPPGLPPAISLGGLDAETALDGPAGVVLQQTARAAGGLADVRVQSLPDLPIQLPKPDLSAIPAPLRPAVEAVIARQLPTMDLLHVTGARAEALASCQDGVPRLSGASKVLSIAVAGQELPVDAPVTKTVTLLGSETIDPSSIPGLPPGLPAIEVPATVARIKLTPGDRTANGVRLTQRALHAEISIAGRQLADLVVGEATVGSAGVSCGGVADLALQCSARRIVLIDVLIDRGRVRLYGAADRRYAGRRVRVRSAWDGRTVARPRLSRSGLFQATAKLPPAAIRTTNRARYFASIGREMSMRLKLVRRMIVSSTRTRGGTVTIAGRVIQPLASPRQAIEVKRRVSCSRWKVVKRFRPRQDGTFRVRLPGPRDGQAAAYRMSTHVRKYEWLPKLYPTFTLPRYVDLK